MALLLGLCFCTLNLKSRASALVASLKEDQAYWVGENAKSTRRNAANGSTPSDKRAIASLWMDSKATSCDLDYDFSTNRVAEVEGGFNSV